MSPRSATLVFLGVDIGGTNIKLGLVDDAGKTLARSAIASEVAKGPAAGVERIVAVAVEMTGRAGLAPAALGGLGLGIPGAVDTRRGSVAAPANLPGWGGFAFCEAISSALGTPARLFNDASAAAYGEYWVGVGRGFGSMVLFTLGTGVGGGAILDGRPLEGEHGLGGEVGHMVIDYNENAAPCPCGGRGHLEAYLGARAVVRRAEDALARGRTSSLSARLAAGETLSPALVAAEAEAGDALAEEVALETARLLGVGVVSALHAFDPGIVALGGAMTFGGATSNLGRRFLDETRREVRRRALPPLADVAVEFAALGSDAGFIGAAGLARAALAPPER